ncbi:hypothetical protein GQ44DRAFT_710926 [Phaeosphaeriaceae sp. PMI808]|nr:hypothetical protein GQ44DRAFT_710926 [Phaeosphaeriaceae sp. PMI808]
MEDPLRVPEPAAFKREREVFSLFAAFKNIPRIEDLGFSPETHAIPSHYQPKPGSDASLAAFCQLAAFRLQASRSLISLIDEKNQYILAEATPRTSLKFDSPLNRTIDLGFGSVCLPRRWGICEQVLDPVALAEGEDGVIIINDLTKSKHADRSYVREGALRFYAGAPLISASGHAVGSICILDDKPRDGLPPDDILYLQDLASVVIDYLHTYTIKDRYRREAEGLYGLMSFAEGASTLQPFSERNQAPNSGLPTEFQGTNGDFHGIGISNIPKPEFTAQCPEPPNFEKLNSTFRNDSTRRDSLSELQDSLLPATIKEPFARAAQIMQQSNDLDGVMFMDASVAGTGFQGVQPENTGKLCQILGFATSNNSSLRGQVLPLEMTPSESNFKWILEHYPNGYSLDCEESPANSEVQDDASSTGSGENDTQQRPELQKAVKDRELHVERVQGLIPNIKSALEAAGQLTMD